MLILHNYVAVERTATITQKKIVMANKYVKVQSWIFLMKQSNSGDHYPTTIKFGG